MQIFLQSFAVELHAVTLIGSLRMFTYFPIYEKCKDAKVDRTHVTYENISNIQNVVTQLLFLHCQLLVFIESLLPETFANSFSIERIF